MLYLLFYPLCANAQKPEMALKTPGTVLRHWNRIAAAMAN
jgi:hypothetical protein